MGKHISQYISTQQRRGLAFGVGSLLLVSWMANSLISQRTQMVMDDTVTLEGWRIRFKTPVGWSEGSPQIDLRGGTVFAFNPISDQYGATNAILRVHRAVTTDAISSRDYCDDIIAQFSAIVGVPSPANVEFTDSNMGDWPAVLAKIHEPMDVFHARPGLHLQVLSAVDRQEHVTYAYAIELQSAGPIRGREQAAWDRIVESIRVVGG